MQRNSCRNKFLVLILQIQKRMEIKKQSLDLNAYGVEEMNVVEMRENNGGLGWGIVIGIMIAVLVDEYFNPGSFAAGYNSVR
jgi:hypothetical protein